MKDKKNTFGDYTFESWIPIQVQNEIKAMWGIFGRTHKDWLENAKLESSEYCVHGPGPNGFKLPPLGATVEFVFIDSRLSCQVGYDVFKTVKGKFIHAWNNMGRLIDEYGEIYYPSSCDRWVRIIIIKK